MPRSVAFGWGAPPFAQQLPSLPPKKAEAFDADNKAITRLSVRGIITEAERDRAIRRATRSIEAALRETLAEAEARPASSGGDSDA